MKMKDLSPRLMLSRLSLLRRLAAGYIAPPKSLPRTREFLRFADPPLPAAVVGVGYLGRFHADKYAASPNANLMAVVDVNQEAAQKTADKLHCLALSDYRDLPSLGVRCASVATTTTTHFEVAKWLLSNGIDVLLEKPMTATLEQAQELIQLAKSNGRILQVGHLERFNPAFREMKKVLTSPRFFEVRRISPFRGRGHDVDVVLDLMIHDIDIVSHLVGRPISKIDAVGVPVLTGSADIANVRICFEGGAVANITASRAAYKTERTIRIFQPDVYIFADYQEKMLKIYTRASGSGNERPEIIVNSYRIEERDALADEVESFLQCIASGGTPEVTGEEGMSALEAAVRISSSIRESNEESAMCRAEQVK